ncbi:hypothetical protein SFRURICE_019465 [Spodoptera frugiperda]|nr:hypothetical protein SFRURICE_019465 [Spodoptera frugiperda]
MFTCNTPKNLITLLALHWTCWIQPTSTVSEPTCSSRRHPFTSMTCRPAIGPIDHYVGNGATQPTAPPTVEHLGMHDVSAHAAGTNAWRILDRFSEEAKVFTPILINDDFMIFGSLNTAHEIRYLSLLGSHHCSIHADNS